ncbi:hypothetical protein L9F63_000258, partial [Diploptera punctata]
LLRVNAAGVVLILVVGAGVRYQALDSLIPSSFLEIPIYPFLLVCSFFCVCKLFLCCIFVGYAGVV